jgi:class 3 adenylate cyclase
LTNRTARQSSSVQKYGSQFVHVFESTSAARRGRMNAMLDPEKSAENRTFVGSIVFIDIVDYSRKTVAEQILIRERFKGLMTAALEGIDPELRLILDTGDGAAISFLGDVKDALTVSIRMRDYLRLANGASVAEAKAANLNRTIPIFNYALRIGVNLGPVKLQQDNHGHPQIVGDGINVAQRITSFAEADQIVVSQSYFDAISAISAQYAKLLKYEGARTDKNVRAHEIYVVGDAAGIAGLTGPSTNTTKSISSSDKSLRDETRERKSKSGASSGGSNKRPGSAVVPISFMQDRNKLLLTGSVLAFVVAGLFIIMAIRKSANKTLVKTGNVPEEVVRADQKSEPAPVVTVAAPVPTNSSPVTNGTPASTPDPAAASATPPPATDEKPATAIAKTVVKPVTKPAVVQGTVSFSIQPWGDVYVNGRSVGASPPLKQSKLAPGTYRIEVKNTTFTPYTVSVEVKSQENVSIKHRFQ